MKFAPTAISGAMVVGIEAHADERGIFARTFDEVEFSAAGLPTRWRQCSTSGNSRKATLRGMHFQYGQRAEAKLVRCTRGRIFDVIIDLRSGSPTFCRWAAEELSAENRSALFIPPGCAHGFITLEDDCEVFYMIDEVYDQARAGGVRWNDPAFGVSWPFAPAVISERDANWPDFDASMHAQ